MKLGYAQELAAEGRVRRTQSGEAYDLLGV